MTILSGNWTLTAIQRDAGWKQGVLIVGSAGLDGIHEMAKGTTVGPVVGQAVEVTPYAYNAVVRAWQPSNERKVMSWDAEKGVIVTIYADDNPAAGDGDFNDLVVECTSRDPELGAPSVRQPPPDLTMPEQAVGHRPEHAPWNP